MNRQEFTILSIEDNKPDFVLLEKALNDIEGLNLNIINIPSGEKSIDFIYKNGEYKNSPTPDLIILDINLPLLDGQEVLKKIKKDDIYKIIPVIMFSTSDSEKDIKKSYSLYANSYITKTFDINELFKKIADMGEYWLKTSEVPSINNICVLEKNNEN